MLSQTREEARGMRMESPFYTVMAKTSRFMPTNKRVTHHPGTRKAKMGKTLDFILLSLF
jgi:hypothetical protein